MKKILACTAFAISIVSLAVLGGVFSPIETYALGTFPTVSTNTYERDERTITQTEKAIWKYLKKKIKNDYGVAGLMGNLFAESGLKANNLQNSSNYYWGITDDEYTDSVDAGAWTEDDFIHDSAGYGLAQWTYWSRKQGLYNYAVAKQKSIGDLELQLEYLVKELKTGGYKPVWNTLTTAESVEEASTAVLVGFEKPASIFNPNTKEIVIKRRAWYGNVYFDRYSKIPSTVDDLSLISGKTTIKVSWSALQKKCVGYEIQYSTSKKFTEKTTKTIRITSKDTQIKKISKLKREKTYYVRIRAVNKSGTTDFYSAWSDYKKIKTK